MTVDTRWKKVLRDISGYWGRALALLLSLSVGVVTVATMLGAYGIVDREMVVNYARTNPASATIEVGEVTPAVLEMARGFPGIAVAEARAVVEARAKVGDEWMRMLLFVADDFEAMQLNTFDRDSGTWPPPTGTMLVERLAASFLETDEGGSVVVRMPGGAPISVPVVGIVHDTTLAPSWQEQTGYGYITRETLLGLDKSAVLDELRIQLDGNPMSTSVIDAKAIELARALQATGVAVESVKVPPPGEHPHQGQILTSLSTFLAFSSLALLMSAILVAAVLAAVLARQTREIAIMKTIGARSGQIGVLYGGLLVLLGAASLVIGLPPGVIAAGRLAGIMADTMNFTVTDPSVPPWVYATLVGVGLLLPLLVSLPTIVAASRTTVRRALDRSGIGGSFGAAWLDRGLTGLSGIALPYLLAIRNMFRRRGRLVLSLALLAVGGGVFMSALNVRDGWRQMADRVMTDRFYDADYLLSEPVAASRVAAALESVPRIEAFEAWRYTQTAFAHDEAIDVRRTYPDRGHGSLALYGVPPGTNMIGFPTIEGRWLQDGDVDAVVITPQVIRQAPGLKVGDLLRLSVGGKPTEWRIVGNALEVGGGGAYVTSEAFDRAAGTEGLVGDVRIAVQPGTPEARATALRAAEQALDDAGIAIERAMPLDRLHAAMIGHVEVPVAMLIAAAVLLAVVGGLGLASLMTVNVLERTREIGVMKAIGASLVVIVKVILGEGLMIAAASWMLAVLMSLPLTRVIGQLAGSMFGAPLPLTLSAFAAATWLGLVLIIAGAASAAPAVRGGRLVVREALAYE